MRFAVDVPDEVYIAIKEGAGRRRLARAFKMSDLEARACIWTVGREIEGVTEDEDRVSVQSDYGRKGAVVDITSLKINTLDEALAAAKVDLDEWVVDRHVVNSWMVTMKIADVPVTRTNWQVKIWLKPKVTRPVEEALREIVAAAPAIAKVMAPRKFDGGMYAGALAPVDVHFGKFAWHPETMGGNMDLKIAARVFRESCAENLHKLRMFPLEKLFLIVGNDLLHIENFLGETPKGKNKMDVDSRLPKVVRVAVECLTWLIDQMVRVAPVDIDRVAGNHDYNASFWICELLAQRYRNCDHVTVRNHAGSRATIVWGDLLVGLTHDASGGKLAPAVNMLPQYWPKEWGESRYREWWTGHKHKAEVTKTKPVYTLGGTVVRQLSALSTIDSWHAEEMFTDAVPACESFLLHKRNGVEAVFVSAIDYLRMGDGG